MQTRLRRGEVPARDAARRVRVISELLRALPAATYTDSLAQLRREAASAGDGGEAESGGEGPVNCDTAQASLADALDMYLLAHRAEAESRLHPSQRRRPASASHAGGGGGGGDGSLRGVSDASVDAALAEVMSTYLGRALPLGAAPAHPHLAPTAVRYVGPRPSTAAAAVNGAYANAGRRPPPRRRPERRAARAATSGVGMLAPPPQAARPPPVLGGAPRPHGKAPPPPPLEPRAAAVCARRRADRAAEHGRRAVVRRGTARARRGGGAEGEAARDERRGFAVQILNTSSLLS